MSNKTIIRAPFATPRDVARVLGVTIKRRRELTTLMKQLDKK